MISMITDLNTARERKDRSRLYHTLSKMIHTTVRAKWKPGFMYYLQNEWPFFISV